MKIAKKLWVLVLAAVMIAMIPMSAFAAGAYVPVAGNSYSWNEEKNDWELDSTFEYTYDKAGHVKKYVSTSTYGTDTETFKWKKDRVVEREISTVSEWSSYYTSFKRTFKNNLVKKQVMVETVEGVTTTYTNKYTWKKKKGTVKQTSSSGKSSAFSVVVNSKKRCIKEKFDDSTITNAYYSNGNIKSSSYKGELETNYKFNKAGYITSAYGTSLHTDGNNNKEGYGTWKNTYSYTMDSKMKCPKTLIITYTSTYNNKTSTSKTKKEYTKFKKVSKSRNCDAFGTEVTLG